MSSRPYVSFDEIKQKLSMRDVLQHYGILDQFRECNGSLVGVCPFPDHVHGPSPNREQFRISRVDGVDLWRCWGDCKQSGNVVQFVMKMEGLSAAHVRFVFAEHWGERLNLKRGERAPSPRSRDGTSPNEEARPVRQTPERAKSKTVQPQTLPEDEAKYQPIRFKLRLDADTAYLKQRGLTEEVIAQYELGLCQRGMLKGYIAIPIWEHPRGEYPFGYLGRWAGEDYDPDEDRPRYKWPKNFPKTRFLYGFEQAVQTDVDCPLIVVEGPFEVYHLVRCGFASTVATFGSSLSDQQAELLVNSGRQIILMFDGDEAGRAGMRKAAAKLITHTFVRVVNLPDGGEPDELSAQDLSTLLKT